MFDKLHLGNDDLLRLALVMRGFLGAFISHIVPSVDLYQNLLNLSPAVIPHCKISGNDVWHDLDN